MHFHGLPFWKVFLCSIVARQLRRQSAGRPVKTRCGLLRAPHGSIGNAGRDWNHPAISSEKTSRKADPIAAETASVVRARADLNVPLTIENSFSIGLMSGVGGGTTRAPAPSMAATTSSTWFGLRWSQIASTLDRVEDALSEILRTVGHRSPPRKEIYQQIACQKVVN
jgi:hypothetical protein